MAQPSIKLIRPVQLTSMINSVTEIYIYLQGNQMIADFVTWHLLGLVEIDWHLNRNVNFTFSEESHF